MLMRRHSGHRVDKGCSCCAVGGGRDASTAAGVSVGVGCGLLPAPAPAPAVTAMSSQREKPALMSRCGAAAEGAPPHALHCRSLRANEWSAGASPGSRPPDWRAAVAETPGSGSGAECRGAERRWKGDVRRSARRQFAHAEGWNDGSFRLDNRCRHDRRCGERDCRRNTAHARAGAVVVRVAVLATVSGQASRRRSRGACPTGRNPCRSGASLGPCTCRRAGGTVAKQRRTPTG